VRGVLLVYIMANLHFFVKSFFEKIVKIFIFSLSFPKFRKIDVVFDVFRYQAAQFRA
jgi:hypothetical protein